MNGSNGSPRTGARSTMTYSQERALMRGWSRVHSRKSRRFPLAEVGTPNALMLSGSDVSVDAALAVCEFARQAMGRKEADNGRG